MAYLTYNNKRVTSTNKYLRIPDSTTFDDWFLPSSTGLLNMLIELHNEGVGGFVEGEYYWASTEHPSIGVAAAVVRMTTGSSVIYQTKNTTFNYVRPARSFTDSIGAYSLRDTGPAGGLIFYVDGAGTTYYEAGPSDISSSSIWSNVTTQIGTTGSAIGTGLSNSQDIVAQSGHTTSAAKLCLDYSLEVY